MSQEQKLEQETKSGKSGQKNDDDKLSGIYIKNELQVLFLNFFQLISRNRSAEVILGIN